MLLNVIVNPAGASGRAWKLWKRLEPLFSGSEFRLHTSTKERGIEDICRELTSTGEETALVVIGGDGTLNEAINGIADLELTRFGFVPCGTGNDMERDMALPKTKEDIVRRLLDGEVKRLSDIGELTYTDENGGVHKRLFNISSDIGFGAATCAFADRSRLKPLLNRLGLGKLIYLVGAVKVCLTAKPARVKITANGRTRLYKRCLCAIAMNHCYEGGGFKFCPHADFGDGKLDLCIGNGLAVPEFFHMLPLAYKGSHLKLRGVYEERADCIEMSSDIPLWVHTDGEVPGKTKKVKMKMIPKKLRLIV